MNPGSNSAASRRMMSACALWRVVLTLVLGSAPRAALAQSPLAREIRAALASVALPSDGTAVCVVDLQSRATVFASNADAPLVPASNMKVVVMAAALSVLGADFVFETVLATDGENLYFVGDGDPAFGDEKLCRQRDESITAGFERWAAALREQGLTAIPGDIIIDESIFDDQRIHPSWEPADLDNWYAAPVGGLNFNDNCVDITVSPSKKRGAPVIVSVEPANALVTIINRCRSGGRGTPILRHAADTFEYKISGRCAKRWPFGSVSFPDPGLLAADSLRTVLSKKGIAVNGRIRRERIRTLSGDLPDGLRIVGRHRTPIAGVLARIGKNSQNLFAECVLKRLGYTWARRRGEIDPQGSWALGRRAAVDVLERAGIDTAGMVVADGSGLSRENRCTARQLTAILAWMQTQPEADLFHDSLAVAGVDGALRKRLSDLPARVHGKTGTMRGIRTLTGYVGGAGESRFAFAVLLNGYKGPTTPYKQLQYRVCRALAEEVSTSAAGSR